MPSIDWKLREVLPHLRDNGRLNVLMALVLRANVRARCWPSIELICKDTGYAVEAVNEAKKWLIKQGAIEMVSYDKRVGKECDLPPRQSVYQLTGELRIDGKIFPYLYVPHTDISIIENSDSEILPVEISTIEDEVVKSVKSVQKREGSKKEKKKTLASRYADADGSPKWPDASQEVSSLRLQGTDEKSARAENPKTKDVTTTDSPLQSCAKGSPDMSKAFGWAVSRAWQSNGMGSLMAQLTGRSTAPGKRTTYKFETPATAHEIYLFVEWWNSVKPNPDTPIPTAAETLKERFDQFRGHPEYAHWIEHTKARFEYDYCVGTGQTPTTQRDGRRLVSAEEQEVTRKRTRMLMDNFSNDYEDRDEDWITGDYVPARK